MEENAEEWRADNDNNDNAETDLCGRGSKGIDVGSQIAGISGSPILIARQNRRCTATRNRHSPNVAQIPEIFRRAIEPAEKSRGVSPLWIYGWRCRISGFPFSIELKAVKNE